jgi:hypothetical protein
MKNKVRDILADKKVKLQELTAQAEAAAAQQAEKELLASLNFWFGACQSRN